MKLNEKINYCRKKAGLSQLDLADLLGVSRQSVSKWETGEANPEVTKIPQLAKVFGVSADWLLSEDEPETADTPPASAAEAAAPDWPDWVEHLPRHISRMVKRFGWLYGVKVAVGGAIFAAFGLFGRAMFHQMIFESVNTGFESIGIPVEGFGYDGTMDVFFNSPFSSFQNSSWRMASMFTGFVIALGIVIMLAGIILAVVLKRWGKKKPE